MANIKEKILEYGGGSLSAAARRMDVTPGYLSGVANGKRPASKLVRDALGIDMRRIVTIEYYERIQPVPVSEAQRLDAPRDNLDEFMDGMKKHMTQGKPATFG